ncbi:MAG: DNA polymerase III subunit delta', partial [Xanthomonadales bacterium]|nr:DNA polymerase III subunit delta' [Xanthomonadales bacterium]
LAEAIVARLVCTGDGEFACGACRSCRLFASGAHPDFTRIEPEEGKHVIRVDQARELLARLALTTSFSDRKVALIVPAELMNKNAANALLKNLEEPPGHAVLVLVSDDASRLPLTIRSRCQAISVRLPAVEAAMAWLQGQGVDPKRAQAALSAAGGSPGQALAFAREGVVEMYRTLVKGLNAVLERPVLVPVLAERLKDVDPEVLWTWLSHCSADAFRGANGASPPRWLEHTRALDARLAGELQRHADRNRALARTSVRQDLLLLEWLLEWTSQARHSQGKG